MAGEIPKDVLEFISRHIDSIEQLEVLMLARAAPRRGWTADEVAAELRISVASAARRLEALTASGLLAAAGAQHRYAPRDPALDAAAAGLEAAYRDRRVAVIGFIFSKPLDAVQEFADAFRLKKDK